MSQNRNFVRELARTIPSLFGVSEVEMIDTAVIIITFQKESRFARAWNAIYFAEIGSSRQRRKQKIVNRETIEAFEVFIRRAAVNLARATIRYETRNPRITLVLR